jgi:hypothetical protein
MMTSTLKSAQRKTITNFPFYGWSFLFMVST